MNKKNLLCIPILSFYEQEDDQPNDVPEECYNDLFYEYCSQPITNSVSGDFKKYFSMPIYDEYED